MTALTPTTDTSKIYQTAPNPITADVVTTPQTLLSRFQHIVSHLVGHINFSSDPCEKAFLEKSGSNIEILKKKYPEYSDQFQRLPCKFKLRMLYRLYLERRNSKENSDEVKHAQGLVLYGSSEGNLFLPLLKLCESDVISNVTNQLAKKEVFVGLDFSRNQLVVISKTDTTVIEKGFLTVAHQNTPGILEINSSLSVGQNQILIQKWYHNGDYIKFLSNNNSLDEGQKIKAAQSLTKGVQLLLMNDLFPCDLRSENVLMDPYNSDNLAVLCDPESFVYKDSVQCFPKTLAFSDPEYFLSKKEPSFFTEKSLVWSLGIIFFDFETKCLLKNVSILNTALSRLGDEEFYEKFVENNSLEAESFALSIEEKRKLTTPFGKLIQRMLEPTNEKRMSLEAVMQELEKIEIHK